MEKISVTFRANHHNSPLLVYWQVQVLIAFLGHLNLTSLFEFKELKEWWPGEEGCLLAAPKPGSQNH